MKTAIIVGLQSGTIDRLKACLRRTSAKVEENWNLQFVPGRRSAGEIHQTEITTAMTLASQSDDSHIIGVSKQDRREKQNTAGAVKPYFRFRWLNNTMLSLSPDEFVLKLNEVLREEDVWSGLVKPKHIRSALLLPYCSFDADPSVAKVWELAQEFGDPHSHTTAQRALNEFEAKHWRQVDDRGRCWTDCSDRVFDHSGQRHGKAPFPRSWKFSYRLEDGFHYDVTSGHSRKFTLLDISGKLHKISDECHVNVDPHGWVRA